MSKIIVLLDNSGSMQPHIKGVVRTLDTQAKILNKKDRVTLYRFAEKLEPAIFVDAKPSILSTMHYDPPGVRTDLYRSITDILAREKYTEPTLLLIITDGLDNVSLDPVPAKREIEKGIAGDMLTVACLCPPQYIPHISMNLGIVNIAGWRTGAELEETSRIGTCSYQDAIDKGSTQVKSGMFDVNVKNVKGLKDVTREYSSHSVPGETDIRDFCSQFGKYELGRALYQLTKPELLREGRTIVLESKKTGKLMSGDPESIRAKLSIPSDRVKIRPMDLGNYNVYLQSKSVNRILVRGTKVLYKKG